MNQVEEIARIIAPEAFQAFDNLTPTEREMWDKKRQRLLDDAKTKARKIIRKLRPVSSGSLSLEPGEMSKGFARRLRDPWG